MDCGEPADNCRFALLRVSHIARTLESHSPICTATTAPTAPAAARRDPIGTRNQRVFMIFG